MKIIDAHAHIFTEIGGERRGNKIKSLGYGKIQVGEEIQSILPKSFTANSFTVSDLLKILDQYEVEQAVLLQNPVFGLINEEIKQALEQFPGRFKGTIQVDPYLDDAGSIIDYYASDLQNTVKFELSESWGWSGKYQGLTILDNRFISLWDKISQLKLNVVIDPGEIQNNGYQVENIEKIAREYPKIKILIEHLGYLTQVQATQAAFLNRWNSMIRLGKVCKNIYFGLSAFPTLLKDPYPCAVSRVFLKEVIDIISIDKILWGSDVPATLTTHSYLQMIDMIREEPFFLTSSEKEQILAFNALSFFNF